MGRLEFCRICTKCTKTGQLKNLFAEGTLIKQISAITGILLDESKQLPQYICKLCEIDLQKAHEFRERCIFAQEYFHRVDKNEKNEMVVEITVKSRYENNFEIKDELPIEENHIEDMCFVKEESCETYPYDCRDLDSTDNCKGDIEDKLADNNREADVDMGFNNTSRSVEKEQSRSKRKESMLQAENKVKHTVSKLKPPAGKAIKTSNDKNHTFICDQCGNHFTCKHHFVTHLQRHTGDKRFQCELCPNKFFTHSELNRHMRKHTGERPFECKHCGRRFSDFSTRIKHERTHTNERPFTCTQCAKAFTTSYILKNHMLVHTGERSFKCDLCSKAFQRQTHLVVHYRSIMHQQNEEKQKQSSCTHTGDKEV